MGIFNILYDISFEVKKRKLEGKKKKGREGDMNGNGDGDGGTNRMEINNTLDKEMKKKKET